MRKYMILPNAAVAACAFLLFYRSFLAGHIGWIASLVTLSPLLALACCVFGGMPRIVKYLAAILNAILFFNCGYAFVGILHMLIKSGALNTLFYPLVGVLWLCSLGMAFIKMDGVNAFCALAVNIAFCALGALGLYARNASAWLPWMTPILFAAFIAAAGLNMCLLLNIFAFRKRREKPAPDA